jgi:hypothetical protein
MKFKFLATLALAGISAHLSAAESATSHFDRTRSEYASTATDSSSASSYVTTASTFGDHSCDSLECDLGCDSFQGHGLRKGCDGLLGYGIIKPSDRCFDDFISPMTNPVFFEDPRTLTEMRLIFINHELPNSIGGHSIQAYAPQFRIALTERLSFIATKGSVINTQSPVVESGFLDMAGGFKYNLYRDPVAGRLLSVGTTFETPSGSRKSFQGNGDGEFNFFLTGGTRIGERAHWLSSGNLRQPVDEQAENRLSQWSNHIDYRVTQKPVYVFTEVNWFRYQSNANAFPIPLEGVDIFNFGAPGVNGNNIVTQAVGTKCKPRSNMEAGFAYEFPLTQTRGIFQERLTLDFILRY